ncbi:MAG: porphobilinogen synthase [Rhodobacteraceae bacterium]|nr:porphobilinogen synthase [Paracoccaceae bacterium]
MMPMARYPNFRARRLRRNAGIRRLVSEHVLSVSDLIWPIFVQEGDNVSTAVSSMPGIDVVTLNLAIEKAALAAELGIPLISLFPQVDNSKKTRQCEEAWNPENLANRAVREIKRQVPTIPVMLDVALDPYNSDGHDGLYRDGEILNDETLDCLTKQALSHAEAGADVLGPSDMMDGRIGRIRQALESEQHFSVSILSYSAKYASAFYGPFRDAIGSSGMLKGNKSTYQMDFGNSDEALRMVQRDLDEGADAVMIKPGMPYLDVIRRVKDEFKVPTFAYQVSGEYAMIKAAADNGWIDQDTAILESLTAFKRAGCDGILTYFAPVAAGLLASASSV